MIDYHIHSNFSADSEATLDEICQTAIKNGMKEIAITDHLDIDYPYPDIEFMFDAKSRLETIKEYRKKYSEISILNGVELGLMTYTKAENADYISKNDFDFVIASVHTVNDMDPYYKEFFENRSFDQALTAYLKEVLECAKDFTAYNVIGHIGYPARYIDEEDNAMQHSDYPDMIDEILKTVISNNRGIEVNTKGIESTGDTLPTKSILKRYKQLGGEIITIGSDAHRAYRVGDCVKETYESLSSLGYKYITRFKDSKPYFEKI